MKVAYANTYYKREHTGGGNVHMEQFVSNAVALGHEIWTWAGNEYPEAKFIPTALFDFVRTVRNMDVLYVRIERKPPQICKWALPPYRSLYRLPVVVWEFNSTPEDSTLRSQTEQDVKRAFEFFRRYSPGCDLAICLTQPMVDYVRTNLGIRRTLIAPNGSDPKLFLPDVPPVSRMAPFRGKFNIVWAGSVKEPYHNLNMLREAAQLLWDCGERERIIFHILGPGMESMGEMPPNVYYWGAVKYQQMPQWLASMNVGLYLSHGGPTNYTTPLKVFDYMASGLALVSTAQPALSDVLNQLGQPDSLVPPGDSRKLADILRALASDRERTRRYGQAGRQLVIDRYNWRKTVEDTFLEIQHILDERRAG